MTAARARGIQGVLGVRRTPGVYVIHLLGLRFRGRHGALREERRLGGPFQVDISLDVTAPMRQRDRLADTLDYRVAFTRTRALMEGRPFRTIEALADALAHALMRLSKVRGVRVRVTKLAPPLMPGATAGVETRLGRMEDDE